MWFLYVVIGFIGLLALGLWQGKKNDKKFKATMPDIDSMSKEELMAYYRGLQAQKTVIPIDIDSKIKAILFPPVPLDSSAIESGKYVMGHPDVDNAIEATFIAKKETDLEIVKAVKIQYQPTYNYFSKAIIPIVGIKNVLLEDASSIEKRVTFQRMLLVGIFAFAWKQKKVNEVSYVIIEWNDGKFDHETLFQFEGKGAVVKGNTLRNSLIRFVR